MGPRLGKPSFLPFQRRAQRPTMAPAPVAHRSAVSNGAEKPQETGSRREDSPAAASSDFSLFADLDEARGSHAPVDHFFGGPPADGAGVPRCSWAKDAAGGHAGLLLHLQLATPAPAPHGLDKPAVLGLEGLGLLRSGPRKMCSSRFFLARWYRPSWMASRVAGAAVSIHQADENLLPAVPADQDALVLLHVLGADLHPQGTPFISYSAAFQPMDWSEESILAGCR